MVARGDIWQDSGMRQGWVWAVSITAVGLLSGCGGKPAQAADASDVLVLEVGGQQPSLRASLVAMGRTVAPGQALRPRSVLDMLDPAGAGGQGRRDDGGGDSRNPPAPVPTVLPEDGPPVAPPDFVSVALPESEWVIVKLHKDETLTHLSRKYLGDGRRFVEIMDWNGWSEPDTRKLRDGQDVKIKRSEMR
jgi:hypothetical protein